LSIVKDFVTSADGTQVGYQQTGSGPGLVIVHGSMSTGQNHTQLAEALADAFTVYLVDRRGRGLTGPYRQGHTVRTDVSDVQAVLDKTGAELAFGVSVGGIICMETAMATSAIRKLAVYEPPLFADGAEPLAMVHRLDRELAEGNVAAALTTAMQGAQMGPGFLNAMPHRLATQLTKLMIRAASRAASRGKPAGAPEYVSFADLAPALHEEGTVIAAASTDLGRYQAIRIPVLLLNGSRSSRFLKSGVSRLNGILPDARQAEIAGGDHSASWNADLRGKPGLVARELRDFFGS
jgi:pimeloyl-ACP methyl ester carboxylesterase